MSELFDDEPGDVDTRRPGGRARALVITGVVLVVAFFALTTFASIYTDRLWYNEVGYGQVFSTMLWTRDRSVPGVRRVHGCRGRGQHVPRLPVPAAVPDPRR